MIPVAVLYARADSIYKTLPGCDVYDEARDARTWPGGSPVVAHPPCRAWGKFKAFAKPRDDEKELARSAVAVVRREGGVIEHPAYSSLWEDQGLPSPKKGARDAFGGFTLHVDQLWWGHKCKKGTFLYIVGIEPQAVPTFHIPFRQETHVVDAGSRYQAGKGGVKLSGITKPEREATPIAFAEFLLSIARKTDVTVPAYRRVFESDVPFRDLLLSTPDHAMTRQTGAANEYVVSGQPEDRRVIDAFADRFETDGEVI